MVERMSYMDIREGVRYSPFPMSYDVMVSILVFDTGDRGSIPRRTWLDSQTGKNLVSSVG